MNKKILSLSELNYEYFYKLNYALQTAKEIGNYFSVQRAFEKKYIYLFPISDSKKHY